MTIVVFAARPLQASAEAPPWLPLGDTGSSGAAAGPGSASPFGSDDPSLGTLSSGSASGLGAEGMTNGGSLALGPIRLPSGSAGNVPTGSAGGAGARGGLLATGTPESGTGAAPPADATPIPTVTAASPAETLQLDTGSVQLACSGSAATGSALLLLGLATGSGFGSLGSSSLVPGLIGPGSSGSSLGSAAVGSAFSGSALLTCLLLLPTAPPPPMSPLQLGPPPPDVRIVPVPAVIPVQTPPRAERPFVEPPTPPQNRPRERDIRAAEPLGDPETWNLMKLMTVLVVTVITVVGIRISPGPRRTR
ncbi:hypothetical protein [Nocardia niwae]|uniref:hypothetical protein n=1 Tax=Nocardia niwae TaxID=626084 RepID=UPI0033C3A7C9